jgi:hypothetical protein
MLCQQNVLSRQKDVPAAEKLRGLADISKSESDYRRALDRFVGIAEKLEKIDSADVVLFGFGFDCFKSVIYLQVKSHARKQGDQIERMFANCATLKKLVYLIFKFLPGGS